MTKFSEMKYERPDLDGELLDVLTTEGKQSGGYCTSIALSLIHI